MSEKQKVYNELIKRHQSGRFHVQRAKIDYASAEQMCQLFGHFIIVRAEYLFVSNEFEYIAYSALFDPLTAGDATPEYRITITQEPDDTWTIDAEKVV